MSTDKTFISSLAHFETENWVKIVPANVRQLFHSEFSRKRDEKRLLEVRNTFNGWSTADTIMAFRWPRGFEVICGGHRLHLLQEQTVIPPQGIIEVMTIREREW
jgi:hypothetical protein